MITNQDLKYLKRAVERAKIALDNGDQPFGSVLVGQDGQILFEDHNHVKDGDHTRHPEFEIAKWAMQNLDLEDRKSATVYTSGEHCPMCAAAHGWAMLGRIVYASSSKQLTTWLRELGVKTGRAKTLKIEDVITDTIIEGPVDELSKIIKQLHVDYYKDNVE